MRRCERAGRRCLVGVIAVAVLLFAPAATGEDKAAGLIKQAEAALGKQDFTTAAAAFELAWREKPQALDVLLRCAETYEKADRADAALLAYRAFQAGYEKASAPSAALKGASRKALKKIKSLGKLETQARAVLDKGAKKLVEFGRKHATDAPLIALRAFERAAVLTQDTTSFDDLLRSLRRKLDTPPDRVRSPFDGKVKAWTDLLAPGTLSSRGGWTHEEPGLVIDEKRGYVSYASNLEMTEDPYVFEMEARAKKGYASMWVVGLVFGVKGNKGLSLWMGPDGVDFQTFDGSSSKQIAAKSHPLRKLDTWHRVSLLVQSDAIEVWLDGEKIAGAKLPDGSSQTGRVGLTAQSGRFEIRELRIGAPK